MIGVATLRLETDRAPTSTGRPVRCLETRDHQCDRQLRSDPSFLFLNELPGIFWPFVYLSQ